MTNIIMNELYKIMARKKLYIFLTVIFLAALLIGLSTLHANNLFNSQSPGEDGLGGLLSFPRDNAQNFPLILLEGIAGFILPILVITLVADMFADEYSEGTLKLPLLRQVNRSQLLMGKVVALYFIIIATLLFVLVTGYAMGLMLLGWGNQFTLKTITMPMGQGILFTSFIYFMTALPHLAFGMIVLLFSVLLSSNGEVIGIGIGILFIMSITGSMANEVSPYLVSGYFNIPKLFYEGFNPLILVLGIIIPAAYGTVFYILSRFVFRRKDILF